MDKQEKTMGSQAAQPPVEEALARSYLQRISSLHRELGIAADYAAERGLQLQWEAAQLAQPIEDLLGRPQQMTPETLVAWQSMEAEAAADGVILCLVSAYRSPEYQRDIFLRKLARGQSLEEILKVNAAPGYSEHHTGRALDLACPDQELLSEDFENSPAFAWLQARAKAHGFRLSFPRDNPHGLLYEPWHWFFQGH